MTATTVTYSLCTCDDGQHEYPDRPAADLMQPDRASAERLGVYIAGSIPRHLIRRTALVTVDVIVNPAERVAS